MLGFVRLTERELVDRVRSNLSRGELTPLGDGSGAIELEDIATIEMAILIEYPMGTDRDPLYRVAPSS